MDFGFPRKDNARTVNPVTFHVNFFSNYRIGFFFIPAKALISVQNCNFSYLQLFLHSGHMQIGAREEKRTKYCVGSSGVNICPTTSCFINFSTLSHCNLYAARMKNN